MHAFVWVVDLYLKLQNGSRKFNEKQIEMNDTGNYGVYIRMADEI